MNNILVGHYNDSHTGVTVVLAPEGAVAGVDVRGGAPGTRETDLLRPGHLVSMVNAVVLSGGSAFGLEASCGVMEWLFKRGYGYNAGRHLVPIVTGAVINDLNDKAIHYPNKAMGEAACLNAKPDNFYSGRIGAGRGATVGKIRGLGASSPGGLGAYCTAHSNLIVEAYFVVNALGDVINPKTGKVIAGTRGDDGRFVNAADCIIRNDLIKLQPVASNTTIGVVVTNAKLDKEHACKLAGICQNGLAKTINPVHTMFDGDTVFVLSTNEVDADFTILGVIAADATANAILNAVDTGKETSDA